MMKPRLISPHSLFVFAIGLVLISSCRRSQSTDPLRNSSSPDIVTSPPEDEILRVHLLPNPHGRSKMVRIAVIAANPEGQWIGATTVSQFVRRTGTDLESL
jgi:hypothetical protein